MEFIKITKKTFNHEIKCYHDLSNFKGLQELSIDQMQSIDGGGEFWDRVSFAAGVTK